MVFLPPVAVTLNDVLVDADALRFACDADSNVEALGELDVALERLRDDQRLIAGTDEDGLERCQFSLAALIEATFQIVKGLDAQHVVRDLATTTRRKARAMLFTVQWLLAKREKHQHP